MGLYPSCTHDGSEPEKNKDEHIAQPQIRQGEWSTGVRDGTNQTGNADGGNGPASEVNQVQSNPKSERQGDGGAAAERKGLGVAGAEVRSRSKPASLMSVPASGFSDRTDLVEQAATGAERD